MSSPVLFKTHVPNRGRLYAWIALSGLGVGLMVLHPNPLYIVGMLPCGASGFLLPGHIEFRRPLTRTEILAGFSPVILVVAVLVIAPFLGPGVRHAVWGPMPMWAKVATVLLWLGLVVQRLRRGVSQASGSAV